MGILDKKDTDWVRRSFLVAKNDLAPNDYRNRIFTMAVTKYTDTTPGGNHCINPPPQFTRHADLKIKGPFNKSTGMGRYYSEAIDDNSQIIHMRFGVEQYNSMTTFFSGFYNSSAGQLARTGRANSAFYMLGKAVGYVVQLASWKLLAIHFIGAAFKVLAERPTSKFYYSKPAMPLYWNAATTILNHLAVNRGIVARFSANADIEKMNDGYQFDDAARKQFHAMGPNIFNKNGTIDLYAVANKAKRVERKRMALLEKTLENAKDLGSNGLRDNIRKIYTSALHDDREVSLQGYLDKWFDTDQSKPKTGDNESANTTESLDANKSNWEKLKEFYNAEVDDGSHFASFRVNATGQVSNQFINSVGESDLQSKINGISSQARMANFSFANGNLIGGAVGEAIGGVMKSVKDFTTGVLDSVELTGLATLAGAAFVDIPKTWTSSTAQLPTSTYTISLQSAYGNPMSQLLNLDMPLAMLLAGALPKSTGKQSHVGPFLVELYDKGRCQTRLGMIDSLSISRGVGNVGWNQAGKALGIDVTFSVVDMSSVMHMPISEHYSLFDMATQALASATGSENARAAAAGLAGGAFDEDTVYSDYLATLAGMSLNDQVHPFRKLKLNLTRRMVAYDSWASISHMASFMGDVFPSQLISAFYRGTDKD